MNVAAGVKDESGEFEGFAFLITDDADAV